MRCKPTTCGCTLKTREKPTTDFVFDFSGTPERSIYANIVWANFVPDFSYSNCAMVLRTRSAEVYISVPSSASFAPMYTSGLIYCMPLFTG